MDIKVIYSVEELGDPTITHGLLKRQIYSVFNSICKWSPPQSLPQRTFTAAKSIRLRIKCHMDNLQSCFYFNWKWKYIKIRHGLKAVWVFNQVYTIWKWFTVVSTHLTFTPYMTQNQYGLNKLQRRGSTYISCLVVHGSTNNYWDS